MKARLITNEQSHLIYGDWNGKDQIIFQCAVDDPHAKELITEFVTRERCFLGVECDDISIEDLSDIPGKECIGYWRMYFSNGSWAGRWFLNDGAEKFDILGIDDICQWICEEFPNGCDYHMETFLDEHLHWGENRWLLKPMYSDRFKVVIDTTYGNGDYPVRIYVYKDKEESTR